MNMMKKFLTVIAALALCTTLAKGAQSQLFKADEVGVSIGGVYTGETSDVAFGVGASYFFTPNIGVDAFTFWNDTEGSVIDDVRFGATFRVPINANIAPYVMGGAGYHWEGVEEWLGYAGAGVELRFNDKWGIFADGSYQWPEESKDGWLARAGVKLIF